MEEVDYNTCEDCGDRFKVNVFVIGGFHKCQDCRNPKPWSWNSVKPEYRDEREIS